MRDSLSQAVVFPEMNVADKHPQQGVRCGWSVFAYGFDGMALMVQPWRTRDSNDPESQ
jgi:hypothetical protein